MHLPAKFIPQHSQRIGNVVGAVAIIVVGFLFMTNYLPDGAPRPGEAFMEWVAGDSGAQFAFLLMTIAMVLFGLAGLTVALLDLMGGSPFNYLIVDRFGIRNRSIFTDRHVSWKDLGPIRVLRLSPVRALGISRRFWIVSDTYSGEERSDFRRPLSSFTLRIPAGAYLASNWFASGVEPAAQATAAWLESLRQLARDDGLEAENAPDAPEVLAPVVPRDSTLALTAPEAPPPDLPSMEERKFGRRSDPTVER
jgi:hypothetical protein